MFVRALESSTNNPFSPVTAMRYLRAAEFDVISKERSAGGSVSVDIARLPATGFVSGYFPLAQLVGDVARDEVGGRGVVAGCRKG